MATDDDARLRAERDLYRRILDLSASDDVESFLTEALALLTTATVFVFSGRPGVGAYPLSFLPLPFLVWIACRFEPGGVALGTLIMSSLAAMSREAAGGQPLGVSGHDALLLLQGFVGLTTVMALTLAAAVSGHKRSEATLRALSAELERLSITDELTGIRNRRGFLLLGGQGWRLARRTGSRCLLVFVDLDGLKRVNDTRGHQAGDALIVEAAQVLTRVFRESDVVARLGGDEFAVLAVVDDAESSVAVSRRLQEAIDASNRRDGLVSPLSMSFGIEELPATDDVPLEDLVSRADFAMYDQKRRLAQARTGTPAGR